MRETFNSGPETSFQILIAVCKILQYPVIFQVPSPRYLLQQWLSKAGEVLYSIVPETSTSDIVQSQVHAIAAVSNAFTEAENIFRVGEGFEMALVFLEVMDSAGNAGQASFLGIFTGAEWDTWDNG
ncbi:hypothetical protein N7481_001547 [Penicillium waksmanii]|uniref:uncharacterized protein n=1 Tax=Penicillium waksmanii TaxID=69791 RepID=UPI00254867FA|nr:uncharacterized protein N7481_001547 [Penicillium waksmanii]KAJ6001138.1 hypothetical protein N7481_001547 [Penicillium waksmanii]